MMSMLPESKTSFDIAVLLSALWQVLPTDRTPIALHEPEFGDQERDYVLDCINSTFVSSVGRYVDRFENDLAEYTGSKRAVAVVNGTAALHIALQLAEVRQGDEVLVPALTFVATANAVHYCGATPHFVDGAESTLGIDPYKLADYLAEVAEVSGGVTRNRRTGARLAAIVPMHTFGQPVEMEALLEVAARWRLPVVEDAAESLGSFIGRRHTGTFGLLGTLSFNGNKIITTGGGGAILTNDDRLADWARHITTTAKLPHRWNYAHDAIGYNYRLPNLNAALGCAQLEQLPRFLTQKRELAGRYRQALAIVQGIRFVEEPKNTRSNYWLNALLLDEHVADQRDAVLEATNAAGIMTRPAWALMHKLPMYAHCPRMALSVVESLERRLINLPSSASLVEDGDD